MPHRSVAPKLGLYPPTTFVAFWANQRYRRRDRVADSVAEPSTKSGSTHEVRISQGFRPFNF
jgi:hypothetical protein